MGLVPSLETLAVQVPAVDPFASVSGVPPSVQLGTPVRPEPPVSSLAVTLRVTGALLFQPCGSSAVWPTERVGAIVSGTVIARLWEPPADTALALRSLGTLVWP